jgi:hypothetical protein
MREIKIVRNGDHVEPQEGRRTLVKEGETVVFTLPPGATGAKITFPNRTPFATQEVAYGAATPLAVMAQAARAQNIFPFVCEMTIGGQILRSEPPNGGEMEVIKPA